MSLRLSPGPVRKAVDELEPLQVKTSVALELLILAKVIVLLCFLQRGKIQVLTQSREAGEALLS